MKPAWESGAGFSALAIAGVLALNYPLIALFDRDTLVFGIPLPFLHVFVVWTALIVGLAVLVEHRSSLRLPKGYQAGEPAGAHMKTPGTGERDTANGVAASASGRHRDTDD